jgi:isopropylmalate/homocitrate/citramalate synthase
MGTVKPFRADKPRVYLVDVTNRDGVQAHGIYISDIERTMINRYLCEMGVFQSEFGFPLTFHEKGYMEANLQLAKLGYLSPIRLEGWVRAMREDVDRASEFKDLKHVNLSISTSQIMINGKFQGRMNERDIIDQMVQAVERAKEIGFETVGVNAEDASRTRHYEDQSYLEDFALAARDAGADRIRYCDTLGYDRSSSIYSRVRRLAEKVQIPIEPHCHNDTGFAVANSIEGAMGALDAGVDAYINTTINGYGERAGNADLVSVALALKFSSGLEGKDVLDPRLDLTKSWKICRYASDATGIPIPPNQPGVGSNAFSHESGIHADGMLKDRRNYELFGPEELGIPLTEQWEVGRRISVGDYSGKKGLVHVLDKYGIENRDLDETIDLVQRATHLKKKALYEDELKLIAKYPEQVRLMV